MLESGEFPVVDQGQSHVAGYTNDAGKVIGPDGACVVFGDHTRAIKFIDFPFVAGADGVKILQPVATDSRHFYTTLCSYDLTARGYGRHYKLLLEQLFPLPPLAEQNRIVARVDELMGLLDRLEAARNAREATRTALRDAALAALRDADTPEEVEVAWERIAGRMNDLFTDPADVDPLRQTVLQLAVRGRLVPQDPNDEPASLLLERIAAEKARLVKEKKIRKPKALPPVSEDEVPFEVPEGWAAARLGEIVRVSSGDNLPAKKMVEGDVPVYGGNGVAGFHNAANVAKPTVVVGRVGALCGNVHLTPAVAWVTDNAFSVWFSEENIDTGFLVRLLRALDLGQDNSATAQPVISGRKIYPLALVLPPLAEQKRIVARVDGVMGLLDRLESYLTSKTSTHDAFAAAAVHHLDA